MTITSNEPGGPYISEDGNFFVEKLIQRASAGPIWKLTVDEPARSIRFEGHSPKTFSGGGYLFQILDDHHAYLNGPDTDLE